MPEESVRTEAQDFFTAHPRVGGILLLLLGVAMAAQLTYAYRHGNSISTYTFLLAPVGLLLGPVTILEPRILNSLRPNTGKTAVVYKILAFFLLAISLGIGLYLQFVTFKDWK